MRYFLNQKKIIHRNYSGDIKQGIHWYATAVKCSRIKSQTFWSYQKVPPSFLIWPPNAPYCCLQWYVENVQCVAEWEQASGFNLIKQCVTLFFFVTFFFFEGLHFHLWEAVLFPTCIVLRSVLQCTKLYRFQLIFRVTCVCKYSHSLSPAQIDRKLLFPKRKHKSSCAATVS